MKRAPVDTTAPLRDPVHSIREAAAYTKKHEKTLYRLIRSGLGPATVRLTPGRIGIRTSALERWINAHTQEKAADT
jgi:predicted DNA-binding transcriptional regulator AlpA